MAPPVDADADAVVVRAARDEAPRAALARLTASFAECRRRTTALAEGLSDADATVQSMRDASPAKWHLAHTTWFFETLVLVPFDSTYRVFDSHFAYLFNSYYETLGDRHPRPQRGMLTRPDLAAVLRYRAHVDGATTRVLDRLASAGGDRLDPWIALIELGIQHEEQHQELLLTDLLHLFSLNPLCPVYRHAPKEGARSAESDGIDSGARTFFEFDAGTHRIGHGGSGFSYDCERPAHEVPLHPYALASHPVTNREWLAFVDDGGYRSPLLWLSDGWDQVREHGWQAPLHWRCRDGEWRTMTLHGECALDLDAPVAHVSYLEADAFARWRGARLPTEFEWEAAARVSRPATSGDTPVFDGHFADSGCFVPTRAAAEPARPAQLFGDVWEWTSSAFAPYPGFRTEAGAAGEYNGKFMCGQYVLRGGSCATPRGHMRPTYRNFFPPPARWQFSGVRLAEDRP